MKRLLLSVITVTAFNSGIFAQKDQNNLHAGRPLELEKKYSNESWASIEGTYQIVVSKPGYSVLLSENLFSQIEALRKPSEDTTITLDEFSTLFLPSHDKVNSGSFIKLESVVYTTK